MVAILGHHHVSMFTDNGQQNNYFYTDILGMRRVKKTVNQDDPSMYHLFYGDQVGSPGTELTFFEMNQQPSRRGTNSISHIGLLVNSHESLLYWQKRFKGLGIIHGQLEVINGRESLYFEDVDGLPLYLMNHQGGQFLTFGKVIIILIYQRPIEF
ncbi:VOC family protein [uncultured Vagococcus sp.]|uniref:VOC family protein n=1 Tax=uncultured Vagococcus sp. TaxID=189676 RepID=UPI0028D64955|nr:VOC family protein [uncultured Vagococcus sp.]